ncbi:TPA: SPI-1 type III secretion system protein SpaN [Salmonella enterica subsp. salamae serovar 28:r:e,n,z15]|nr:SPI-1 type III secretion system protein SpaN [Salmonella enterica subsp. salamae serovar 28:r:e,n,z15]
MGDVSAVSSSGNILLPQQDEVGGLSEALKKAVEKHKTEYSDDKKDREYGDSLVMHKETALPVLLAALRHGAPAKSEHHNGNISGLHHNGKGELRIAEKLLKVTAEKSVGLISTEAKVDKSVGLISTEAKVDKSAALLSSKNGQPEGVSGKKLSADLKAVESVSELAGNTTGIADDNIKALPGDNKAIAGEGVRKEGVLLARDVAPSRMAATNTNKSDDKEHKKIKEASQLPLQPTTLSDLSQLSSGDEKMPLAAQSKPMMTIFPTTDGVKGEDSSLTYRFQRWGNDYSVNIQARQVGEFSLIPSNTQVEHRLHDQWQNGNPQRWHLTRDDQQNPQQQQHRQQAGEEDDA